MTLFDRVPLASPEPPEDRARLKALLSFFSGRGSAPAQRTDPLEPFQQALRRKARKLISMRLDVWMLELSKAVAARHGMDYQRVLRLWIEQGLRRSVIEGARTRRRKKRR